MSANGYPSRTDPRRRKASPVPVPGARGNRLRASALVPFWLAIYLLVPAGLAPSPLPAQGRVDRWPTMRQTFVPKWQTLPHPAVVRVVVQEGDGMSVGSGTLVDVHQGYGLVVTNWHVVRDVRGAVHVVFPNGFRSAAQIVKWDKDWDLAALAIWRPASAVPVPLARQAPRPGDVLTIAGYGSGRYRAASGRCTQYVAPEQHLPYEMVELAAVARQGDSGGPIFNDRGELAGVLFGSNGRITSGSYAGRVQQFLTSVQTVLRSPGQAAGMLAGTPPAPSVASHPSAPQVPERLTQVSGSPAASPSSSAGDPWPSQGPPPRVALQPEGLGPRESRETRVPEPPPLQAVRIERSSLSAAASASAGSGSPSAAGFSAGTGQLPEHRPIAAPQDDPLLAGDSPRPASSGLSGAREYITTQPNGPGDSETVREPGSPLGETPWEWGKTLLAVVGVLAMVVQVTRFLGQRYGGFDDSEEESEDDPDVVG